MGIFKPVFKQSDGWVCGANWFVHAESAETALSKATAYIEKYGIFAKPINNCEFLGVEEVYPQNGIMTV